MPFFIAPAQVHPQSAQASSPHEARRVAGGQTRPHTMARVAPSFIMPAPAPTTRRIAPFFEEPA